MRCCMLCGVTEGKSAWLWAIGCVKPCATAGLKWREVTYALNVNDGFEIFIFRQGVGYNWLDI